jgi:hypothetical protein
MLRYDIFQPKRPTMKKANLVLMAAMAAAGLAGVAGGSLLPVTAAVAASKDKAEAAPKQKLSPTVAKPLVAAQAAMNARTGQALVQSRRHRRSAQDAVRRVHDRRARLVRAAAKKVSLNRRSARARAGDGVHRRS